ncbi:MULTISPECIES: hypothetical protein [Nocardia]|uniref:Uncharacterized protein n=2 Tax=Nocardia TaxID=1817 RepID=A0A846XI26_9NOCA|nr:MULTISPECIES: hypothetical protein [Nocardia]MBF6456054.1 hypothetical protein [Nocardia cyriacigeorgica]MBF6477125.1 hypothetical protein [Nocardia cyriacigeorgica]MBF6553206.1 hypothetical protein [Nocardia cyriacigeorgica]NKY34879.1 hypothetical protein [Nocardia speluncae]TLF77706.1 hypothetical protein FEK34_15515 [Nocardia cyriacigeorgica]
MSNSTTEYARTAVEDALWAVIGTEPTPATELAIAAGISQSKTRKLLNQWATDGTVTRHTNDTNPRSAARWALPTETHDSTEPEPEPSGSGQPPEHDSTSDTGDADTEPATETAPSEPIAETDTDSDTGACAETGVGQQPPGQADGEQAPEVSKLAPGALRGLVEDHLRDHPGQEFSPHQIGKALGGRSSGAVYNALLRLVGTGVAQMTTERPKKFMLAQPAQP